MSFRQFGGLNYSAKSNIITNQFSNSGNLGITDTLGQPNSKIVSQSHIDMSANSVLHIGKLYFMDGTVQSTAAANDITSTKFPQGIEITGGNITISSTSQGNIITAKTISASSINARSDIAAANFYADDAFNGNLIGNVTGNATTATKATNLSGTSQYSIPYQSASGVTSYIPIGTSGKILAVNSSVNGYEWVTTTVPGDGKLTLSINSSSYLSISQTGPDFTANQATGTDTSLSLTLNATNANTARYIVARDANGNFSAGTITADLSGNATTATTATNLAGGAQFSIPYQTAGGATDFIANGTTYGYVLTSNTLSAPSWKAVNASTITTTDATSTVPGSTLYPVMTTGASPPGLTPYVDTTNFSYDASNNFLNVNGSLSVGSIYPYGPTTLSINPLPTGTTNIGNGINTTINIGDTVNNTSSVYIKGQATVNSNGGVGPSDTSGSSAALNVSAGGAFINKDLMVYGGGTTVANIYGPNGGTLNIGNNANFINIGNSGALGQNVFSLGSGNATSTDNSSTTLAGLIIKNGGAFINKDLMVYGGGTNVANIYGPSGGTLTIGGGSAGPYGVTKIYLGNNITNPQVSILTQISSTSTSTGSLIVAGGVGITGACYASSFNSSSDYRIKENIQNLDDEFNIDKLRPVTYKNKNTEKQDIGFIAHEVQEEFPYLVSGEKDGEEMQSLNYIGLIGVLVKEIQELKKRVSILENK